MKRVSVSLNRQIYVYCHSPAAEDVVDHADDAAADAGNVLRIVERELGYLLNIFHLFAVKS